MDKSELRAITSCELYYIQEMLKTLKREEVKDIKERCFIIADACQDYLNQHPED